MRRFEAVELPAGWTVRDRQEGLVAVPRSSWPEVTAAMVAGALTELPAYAVALRWATTAGGDGR